VADELGLGQREPIVHEGDTVILHCHRLALVAIPYGFTLYVILILRSLQSSSVEMAAPPQAARAGSRARGARGRARSAACSASSSASSVARASALSTWEGGRGPLSRGFREGWKAPGVRDVSLCTRSEKGVTLARRMQVGPCIPVGIQQENVEVGPTSGSTLHRSN
jgi:hypothetical protein